MARLFPRPDRYVSPCGHLYASITNQKICHALPFLRGLRTVFISDIHVTERTLDTDIDTLTASVQALSPHLLLLGGDYSDSMEGSVRFFNSLKRLKPPLGCYGVLGNNDAEAWKNRYHQLRSLLAKAGCRLLVNESESLTFNGGHIIVAGTDECNYGHPDYTNLYPSSASSDTYRILVSHYPILPKVQPDLLLSGHTHGGQFNILGLTPYSVGFERILKPRAAAIAVSGLHEINGMTVLVSKGIGASRIQWRVGVQPEINSLLF